MSARYAHAGRCRADEGACGKGRSTGGLSPASDVSDSKPDNGGGQGQVTDVGTSLVRLSPTETCMNAQQC